MRKLVIISGLLLLTAAFSSCKGGEDGKPSVPEAIKVKTVKAATTELAGSRVYSGTVEESGGAVVSFPVAGTVQQIFVSVGDRVAKGQTIATLDGSNLRSAYEMAQATLDNAQDAYNRMKMLHDANSLPDMQWVEVQNGLRQAQSAVDIARRGMNDATLTAPFAGYVSEKPADAGMTIAPGMPVVKLVTINPVKVSVSVPENEIATLPAGATASIKVGALGGAPFTGRVVEKGVAANPLSRSYDVKMEVANPDGQLLPGMICDVVIDSATPRRAIVLPVQAVMLDADNNNFVWLDVNGKAEKRAVRVEGMTDGGIIVGSGINDGDLVIVDGMQKVSRGSSVIADNK